jgi:hypothetical protein
MAKLDMSSFKARAGLRDSIEEIRATYPLSAMAERFVPVRRNSYGGIACDVHP